MESTSSAVKFEVKELIETTNEQGEKLISRRYDVIINGVKHEMKCWREWQGWSDNVIINQFVNDLKNPTLRELEDLKWVFKKTSGITEEVLKDKVIGALESTTGREALEQAIKNNMSHFQKLFGENVSNADDVIEIIKNKNTFNKIFIVYE